MNVTLRIYIYIYIYIYTYIWVVPLERELGHAGNMSKAGWKSCERQLCFSWWDQGRWKIRTWTRWTPLYQGKQLQTRPKAVSERTQQACIVANASSAKRKGTGSVSDATVSKEAHLIRCGSARPKQNILTSKDFRGHSVKTEGIRGPAAKTLRVPTPSGSRWGAALFKCVCLFAARYYYHYYYYNYYYEHYHY